LLSHTPNNFKVALVLTSLEQIRRVHCIIIVLFRQAGVNVKRNSCDKRSEKVLRKKNLRCRTHLTAQACSVCTENLHSPLSNVHVQ